MKSLTRVRLFATPWTVAYQTPPSMGFSRQEYWSGLPCPPPGDLPNLGIEPRSSTLRADSLPAEPLGKPRNTGVGSHSLLQGIFPTQGSNPGPPHCKRILYQLSHQGSPRILEWAAFPFSGDLHDLGFNPGSPALQVDSLQAEPPGKPKNTGVGSLSLLQQIFPTLESNWVSCIAGRFFTN